MKRSQTYFGNMNKLVVIISLILLPVFSYSQCHELIWNDEFNYTGKPDSMKWAHQIGGNGWGNQELQYYTDRIENSFVQDGKLYIKAIKEEYSGNKYTSARLNSLHEDSWKYGRFEVSAKLPSGVGTWPAIWMLPSDWVYSGWPASGEIDIMEHVGYNQGIIHGTVHTEAYNHTKGTQKGGLIESETVSDTFHVYAVEWSREKIDFFFDSIKYFTFYNEHESYAEWPFDQSFYYLLNIAIGGTWGGAQGVDEDLTEAIMEIDYARVYKGAFNLSLEGPDKVLPNQVNTRYNVSDTSLDYTYNWSVEGGQVIQDNGHSIMVHWDCNPVSVSCEVYDGCDTTSLITLMDTSSLSIFSPLIIPSGTNEMQIHTSLMNNTSYNWSVIEGNAEFTRARDSSMAVLDWNGQTSVVRLDIDNNCGTYSITKKIYQDGQYAYPDPGVPHVIPGDIEAVHFDHGGNNMAYFDKDMTNQGLGPRQDENVDTEFGDGENPNVGWTENGEWLEYSIDVEKDSIYGVKIRMASNLSSGDKKVKILANGEERAIVEAPYTGAWDDFNLVISDPFELFKTDTLLRLEVVSGNFNIGRMTFFYTNKNSLEQWQNYEDALKIYPNPTVGGLHIESIKNINTIDVFNLHGQVAYSRSSILGNSYFLDQEFMPGVYIVSVFFENGRQAMKKLIVK